MLVKTRHVQVWRRVEETAGGGVVLGRKMKWSLQPEARMTDGEGAKQGLGGATDDTVVPGTYRPVATRRDLMYRYLAGLVVPVVSLDAPPGTRPQFFSLLALDQDLLAPTHLDHALFLFLHLSSSNVTAFPLLEARVDSTLSTPPQPPVPQTQRPIAYHIPGRLTLTPALAVRSAFLVPAVRVSPPAPATTSN